MHLHNPAKYSILAMLFFASCGEEPVQSFELSYPQNTSQNALLEVNEATHFVLLKQESIPSAARRIDRRSRLSRPEKEAMVRPQREAVDAELRSFLGDNGIVARQRLSTGVTGFTANLTEEQVARLTG
jgi:hypothetical protein